MRAKTAKNSPVMSTTMGRMYREEAYWAALLAKLTNKTVAEIVSPLVREHLRKALKAHGIDPEAAYRVAGGGQS